MFLFTSASVLYIVVHAIYKRWEPNWLYLKEEAIIGHRNIHKYF